MLISVVTPSAEAWGIYGHRLANEAATAGVSAEMPHFFHDAYPRLAYLGYDPDRWRRGGPSLTSLNFPDHFLDYEYVDHLELPNERYEFIELLHESGTLRRYGIDQTTPGFSPWKIAELMELIENQWIIWLSAELDEEERKQVEENIIHYSGVVGHFVADAANPHHASIHYNGWVGHPNPRGYPNDCDAHWRFETAFATRVLERREVFESLQPFELRTDYFDQALGFVRSSYSLIDEMYALDRDGAFTGTGTPEGREFVTERLARGASWLRDLWVSAYRAAQAEVAEASARRER